MRALVTGAAGFIGSTLTDRLLADGAQVRAVDCFTNYYARPLKETNLAQARHHANFEFIEGELIHLLSDDARAAELLEGVDTVFHQAAQAGVRASWGTDFNIYCDCNILATQRLLEACRRFRPEVKFVYASSSSVYGETEKFPMHEDDTPRPVSPYGVSKLAAEHLCVLYAHNHGVHTVSLRYFTVYGPRQRPDMAFHKLIKAALSPEHRFALYGDGHQTRDFTFVEDIVSANIAAAQLGPAGRVYNLGGGSRVSMLDVIKTVEDLAGRKANVEIHGRQFGDVTHTGADTTRARTELGFSPKVELSEGLARELAFIRDVILPAENVE